jgi:hypothetical protein
MSSTGSHKITYMGFRNLEKGMLWIMFISRDIEINGW